MTLKTTQSHLHKNNTITSMVK